MKRDPVSFELHDITGELYNGTEDEMLEVFTVLISDLKALEQKYGKQAVQMKATYNKKPQGELKLYQLHKLTLI